MRTIYRAATGDSIEVDDTFAEQLLAEEDGNWVSQPLPPDEAHARLLNMTMEQYRSYQAHGRAMDNYYASRLAELKAPPPPKPLDWKKGSDWALLRG